MEEDSRVGDACDEHVNYSAVSERIESKSIMSYEDSRKADHALS
jgi:hypothetical protein